MAKELRPKLAMMKGMELDKIHERNQPIKIVK